MLKTINGSCFSDMIKYGINNLEKYCDVVNDLNVFPVPDGDTGTNMVMTLKNGLGAVSNEDGVLCQIAQGFANATVYGARGNSGVIISQFFKGVSEGLRNAHEADVKLFSAALNSGCDYAYAAVATPVEGTILTVMKEATTAVCENLNNISSIDELVSVFLQQAKIALDNTPNLLAILAKAGVIDSGGAGLVYFFEGIQRYLNGEPLEAVQSTQPATQYIDYSKFNRHSSFEFGYCTETLLQLTVDDFDQKAFSQDLQKLGESIVTSFEADKVKVHIHTHTPEKVLAFCHKFGEFLSLKIENMSVQHTQTVQKYLCATSAENSAFAVVAVAPNSVLQTMFSKMGADVVILSAEVPSSQDFIEAFEHVAAKEILVFPNNSNSILSAKQAGKLYKNSKVTVLKSSSIAQCYSAMAVIDFSETDVDDVVEVIEDTIDEIYEVAVARATKNTQFGKRLIAKNDYFAIYDEDILQSGISLEKVVALTVKEVVEERDPTVINVFYGKNVLKEQIETIAEDIERDYFDVEVCLISTEDIVYDLILSFE